MIYKIGAFEILGFKHIIKTTESSIPLHDNEMVLKLLNKQDLFPYLKTHKFLYIGLVHIAFRPLTLEGLSESFLAALRDGRNLSGTCAELKSILKPCLEGQESSLFNAPQPKLG